MLIAVTFLGSLAWSFVFVALPFQVERLSTSGPAGTLAWTGWILGVPSLAAVVTGPLWARYGERTDPKTACVIVQTLQGLGFLATALARSVIQLLFARLLLGTVGSFSTLAFVIAGRESDLTAMRRRLGGDPVGPGARHAGRPAAGGGRGRPAGVPAHVPDRRARARDLGVAPPVGHAEPAAGLARRGRGGGCRPATMAIAAALSSSPRRRRRSWRPSCRASCRGSASTWTTWWRRAVS